MSIKNKVQLITYPESLGGSLRNLEYSLEKYFEGLFQGGIHILPPYPSTGDHGFSPITYFEIDPRHGDWKDLQRLAGRYDLMLDLMVNHISSSSSCFQDYLRNGAESPYADMFLEIHKVWPGGDVPADDLRRIFLRRPMPFSDFQVGSRGDKTRLWTTFGKGTPSDQVDMDVNSSVTRDLFTRILAEFAKNGIHFIRLDAVGYVIKKPGTNCFFVQPEIYQFMDWIKRLAAQNGIELLPELHDHYATQVSLSQHVYWIYDFMLPYLVLEALLLKNSRNLVDYLRTRPAAQFTMLDCHDGIPVKPDLDGYYDQADAKKVVELCEQRGGNMSRILSNEHKDPDGFDVHQIRGTYYSMLNENDDAYFAARAIQLFTPGIPQIYYVGLLAGRNDQEAGERTHDGREINRHAYSLEEIEREVQKPIVKRLMKLIEFRNSQPAFDGECTIEPCSDHEISIRWKNGPNEAHLHIHLETNETEISWMDSQSHQRVFLE
jgi:sucrose phosphorylase